MDKTELNEKIAEIKAVINDYAGENEETVVRVLMWVMYWLEGGKPYADSKVKLWETPEGKIPDDFEKRGCC